MADPIALLQLSVRLLSIGLLIRAVETLWIWREFAPDGMLASRQPWGSTLRAAVRIDAVISGQFLAVAMLLLQAGTAAASLFLPVTHPAMPAIGVVLVAATTFCNVRFVTLRDASDVMAFICLAGIAAALLDEGDGRLRAIGLGFVAVQASICYLATAAHKLTSPPWRTGLAMVTVFQSTRHRVAAVGSVLGRYPAAAFAMAWAVILVEALLGLSVVLPRPLMTGVLAAGIGFHLGVALLLRLPAFFWAFTATYPAIYFLHGAIRDWLA
jgi:hypothetical protein